MNSTTKESHRSSLSCQNPSYGRKKSFITVLLRSFSPLRIPWQCVPDVERRSRTVSWRRWASVSMLTVSAAAPAPAYLRGHLSSPMTTTIRTVSRITTGNFPSIQCGKRAGTKCPQQLFSWRLATFLSQRKCTLPESLIRRQISVSSGFCDLMHPTSRNSNDGSGAIEQRQQHLPLSCLSVFCS